jgi:hypothetical protein
MSGEIISDDAEIDDQILGGEVDGMTARGFDPCHPPRRTSAGETTGRP